MQLAQRSLILGLVVSCLGAAVTFAEGPRQYYSSWGKHPSYSYYYRTYYYKPAPTYYGYKHHYVIYHPAKPKHVYFYNPYQKHYWGRCFAEGTGEPLYQHLPAPERKPILSEIPEAAFPKAAAPPVIPEAKDNVKLDLPPDDVPDLKPQPAPATASVGGVPTPPAPAVAVPVGIPADK